MNFRLTNEIAACKILQEGPGYVKGCIKKIPRDSNRYIKVHIDLPCSVIC